MSQNPYLEFFIELFRLKMMDNISRLTMFIFKRMI